VFKRHSGLLLCAQAELVHTVSPVQRHPDLFIGFDKAFQLSVQVSVLAVEDTTVMSEGINLTAGVFVAGYHRLVGESVFFLW